MAIIITYLVACVTTDRCLSKMLRWGLWTYMRYEHKVRPKSDIDKKHRKRHWFRWDIFFTLQSFWIREWLGQLQSHESHTAFKRIQESEWLECWTNVWPEIRSQTFAMEPELSVSFWLYTLRLFNHACLSRECSNACKSNQLADRFCRAPGYYHAINT